MGKGKIHLKIFTACLFLISFTIVSGCEFGINDELARVASPDKKVEAILIRTNSGGATTTDYYRIMIVPSGRKPKRSNTVFLAKYLQGEDIRWVAPKTLEIRYENATIVDFQSSWRCKDVENSIYVVEVHERKIEGSKESIPQVKAGG